MSLTDLLTKAASGALRGVVTSGGIPDGFGVVPGDPSAMARQVNVDLNTLALARMFSSEGFKGDARAEVATKIVEGQTAIAVAQRKGLSLYQLLSKDGKFGRQGYVGYAATSVDPRAIDIEIAKAVIADTVPDFAKGGTHFLSPWKPGATQGVYPPGHPQAGRPKPLPPFEGVINKWANEGSAWVGDIPGINSYHFMAFRKTDLATAKKQAQAAVASYQAGDRGPTPWTAEAIANVAAKGSGIIGVLALFGALGLLIYRRFYG